jgi:BirA family transcriptional regulator, biotin operon repressor / biotin---[acetyl-CoA-carboxylase] ligase
VSPVPLLAGDLPRDFADALAARADRLLGFAAPVVWYDTVSSTNDLADRAAAAGAGHGTVVAADCQESGRGRMGRTWHSPPGAGLYISAVLRPGEMGAAEGGAGVAAASRITLTAGVACAEALRNATGLPAAIKWPNDVVVGPRKVCGILAEAASSNGRLRHVILGYGINVLAASYPPEIAERATSIEAELGRFVDRAAVFAESLACLAERIRQLSAGGFDAMLDAWRTMSPSSTGARVEIVTPGGWTEAVTVGVDRDGALLAKAGAIVRRVVAGEVRWVGR